MYVWMRTCVRGSQHVCARACRRSWCHTPTAVHQGADPSANSPVSHDTSPLTHVCARAHTHTPNKQALKNTHRRTHSLPKPLLFSTFSTLLSLSRGKAPLIILSALSHPFHHPLPLRTLTSTRSQRWQIPLTHTHTHIRSHFPTGGLTRAELEPDQSTGLIFLSDVCLYMMEFRACWKMFSKSWYQ